MVNWFISPEMARQVSERYCKEKGFSFDVSRGQSNDPDILGDFMESVKEYKVESVHHDFMNAYPLPQNPQFVMARFSDRNRWEKAVGCFGVAWLAENDYTFDIDAAMEQGQIKIDELNALRSASPTRVDQSPN